MSLSHFNQLHGLLHPHLPQTLSQIKGHAMDEMCHTKANSEVSKYMLRLKNR
jgi:hypothetical protein